MTPEEIEKLVIETFKDKDGKTCAICPNCFQTKKLGTAGVGNLKAQHLMSDACKNARAKHDSKAQMKSHTSKQNLRKTSGASVGKSITLSAWLAKTPSVPVPSTLAKAPVYPKLAASHPRTASAAAAPLDTEVSRPAHPTLSTPSVPGNIIDEMSLLIPRMPESIPEATDYDEIAAFAGDPSFLDDRSLSAEDLWEEFLNKWLKGALGWNDDHKDMDQFIRRGLKGMAAVLNFVRYFVIKRGVSIGLFEGKMEHLMTALRKCTVGSSQNLTASSVNIESDSPVEKATSPSSALQAAESEQVVCAPAAPDIIDLERLPSAPLPDTQAPRGSQHHPEVEVINLESYEYEDTLRKSPLSSISSTRRETKHSVRMCKGVALAMPPSKNPHGMYPHGMHTATDLHLPWGYEIRNGFMTLYANSCPRLLSTGTAKSCKACRLLHNHPSLEGIRTRLETGVHENSRLIYHGVDGLVDIIHEKARRVDYLRLRSLNTARKLLTKATSLDDHKRLLLAISSGKTHRVDRVLSIGLRQRKGTRALMASVLASANGYYRPRSFTEEEDMKAIIIWRLAGNRVAELNHRANGAPSVSYLRTRSTVPPITPSPGKPTFEEVKKNMEAVFASILDILKSKLNELEVVHPVLMFDELATKKRLRYDALTNMILGLCRQHGQKTSLEFINEDDLKEVFRLLDEEEIHYASEATISAVGLLAEDHRVYPARPVLVSGDCKKETGPQHARVIQTVLDGVNSLKEKTRIRITSLASDGEACRGALLVQLTLKNVLEPSSPIYTLLSDLSFMDFHVGDDDLTCDKDWKHVFKRLRNLLLRERGLVVNNIRITPDILKDHLRSENYSPEHISTIFNVKDLQDVKLAVDLLKDVWTLPRTVENANPGYKATREAIWTLGKALYHLVFPYLCLDLSLSEQIEHLSAASHMFLSLYSKSGKHFVPTALYCDIQHMIKNAIFCVAKAKKDRPNSKFYLILLGTDRLEELFGILRTMVGNDANLNILQLVGRLAGTTEVANILARYPEWDRGPRRLKCPVMSRDSTEILDSADHLKPGSWKGDVSVANVSIRTSWTRGRHLVEVECPSFETHLKSLQRTAGVNILAPRGTALFKMPLDIDDTDESLEDDVPAATVVVPAETEVPDQQENGDCRVEVEDALLDPDPHINTGGFKKTVVFRGQELVKARALSLASKYRTHTSSTDRLRRVKAIDRYAVHDSVESSNPVTGSNEESEKLLVVSDPVASLVSSDGRIWLCIGEVNTLKLNGKNVESIPHSVLQEKIVSVSFQLLGLTPATRSDDPSALHDWKTFRTFEKTLTVPGRLICPINPTISTTHDAGTEPWYLLSSDVLVAVAASLFEDSAGPTRSQIPVLAKTADFPYRNRRNEGCFVCGDVGNITATTLDCPRCLPTFTFSPGNGQLAIAHMAAHIKHDDTIDKNVPACGLCLQPPSLCRYFIKKGQGAKANLKIDKKKSKGCLVNIPWTYSTAARSLDTSPCSNAPLICPLCPSDEPAVWRYFLEAHFKREHPGAVDKYAHMWKLTAEEEAYVEDTWMKRGVVKKTRNRKSKKIPIPVSEEHRAHLPEQDALVSNDQDPGEPENASDKSDGEQQDGSEDASDSGSEAGDHNDDAGRRENPMWESSSAGDCGGMQVESDTRPDSPDLPTVGEVIQLAAERRREAGGNGGDGRDRETSAVSMSDAIDSSDRLPQHEASSACTEALNTDPRHLEESLEIQVSNRSQQRVEDPEESMTNDTQRRSTRKRTNTVLNDSIRACMCEEVVDPSEENTIECQRPGCESQWYHIKCIPIPKQWPAKWYCPHCDDIRRSRGNKRPRGGVPK